jgi:hypothetical protein
MANCSYTINITEYGSGLDLTGIVSGVLWWYCTMPCTGPASCVPWGDPVLCSSPEPTCFIVDLHAVANQECADYPFVHVPDCVAGVNPDYGQAAAHSSCYGGGSFTYDIIVKPIYTVMYGVVRDAFGAPVPGVTVYWYRSSDDALIGSDVTDGSGYYHIGPFDAGSDGESCYLVVEDDTAQTGFSADYCEAYEIGLHYTAPPAATPRVFIMPIGETLHWVAAQSPADPADGITFYLAPFDETITPGVEGINAVLWWRGGDTVALYYDQDAGGPICRRTAQLGRYDTGEWTAEVEVLADMQMPSQIVRIGDLGAGMLFSGTGADENKLYFLMSVDGETWTEADKVEIADDAAIAPAGLTLLGGERIVLVARYQDTGTALQTLLSSDFGRSWA